MAKKLWMVKLVLESDDDTYVVIYRHIQASDSASAVHLARMRLKATGHDNYQDYALEDIEEEIF